MELPECLPAKSFKILGGGTNVLITKNIDQPVLHIQIKGIELLEESKEQVLVKVGAGEVWSDTVDWAVEREFGGIENLSLIPGTAGAAPVQNIGAYGVELKDVLHAVEAFDVKDKTWRIIPEHECGFGYRDSKFKREWKDRLIITSIQMLLKKASRPNIQYAALKEGLLAQGIQDPSIHQIAEMVKSIRRSKLPDPAVIGNAGSFFKNASISRSHFEELQKGFQDIPGYVQADGMVKVPTGWLIERCGWKGKREGDVACYEKQALVLVNYGAATGDEILRFSLKLAQSVFESFGIRIQPEVNLW